MKKKPEVEKDNSERWMLTYLDMITLLFLFFVVMYAMSKVDQDKYQTLAASLTSVFSNPLETATGSGTGEGRILTPKSQTKPEIPMQSKKASSRVYDKAYDIIQADKESDKIKVRQEQRGVVVQLGAELFFKPGSADLPQDASQTLLTVAKIASSLPNDIQIEGHTDPTPPDPKEGFKSNWELSGQRAINVLKMLVSMGVDGSRLSAVAYGDSRPIASNDTPEGRAYNRRIDVVILFNPADFNE